MWSRDYHMIYDHTSIHTVMHKYTFDLPTTFRSPKALVSLLITSFSPIAETSDPPVKHIAILLFFRIS